jgi:hypothetical protein
MGSCIDDTSRGCADGFTGIMCEECEQGRGRIGYDCIRCSAGRDAMGLVVIVLVFAGILVFLTRSSLAAVATLPVVTIRTLLDYVQTLFFIGSFGFSYPQLARVAIFLPSSVSTAGSHYLPFDCLFGWDAADTVRAYAGVGLALTCVFAVALGLTVIAAAAKSNNASGAGDAASSAPGRSRVHVALVASVVVLMFLHPAITVEVIRAFRCRDIGGVFNVLASDVRVACGTREHARMRVIAAAALGLFSLGGVVAVFGILVLSRRRCAGAGAAAGSVLGRAGSCEGGAADTRAAAVWTSLSGTLSFLSAPFSPSHFWWGIVPLARKTAILTTGIFVRSRPTLASFVATVVILLNIIANLVRHPFPAEWPVAEGASRSSRAIHRALMLLGGPGGIDVLGLTANLLTLSIGPVFDTVEPSSSLSKALVAVIIAVNVPMFCIILLAVAALVTKTVDRGTQVIAARRSRRFEAKAGHPDGGGDESTTDQQHSSIDDGTDDDGVGDDGVGDDGVSDEGVDDDRSLRDNPPPPPPLYQRTQATMGGLTTPPKQLAARVPLPALPEVRDPEGIIVEVRDSVSSDDFVSFDEPVN